MAPRRWSVLLVLSTLTLAGCLDGATPEDEVTDPTGPVEDALDAAFAAFTIPAVHTGHGLYEPTIDVSPEGTLYVSAHSTGVGQAPAPAFYSLDDGATWANLGTAPGESPQDGLQAGTAPGSDEIFIVAGDDGTAWGVDVNLHSYPMHGWGSDGSELVYYNANAYDRTQSANPCNAGSLNDRPWAAYANGWLLVVNNPGGGPVQVGSMQVPPAQPVGAATVAGPTWNQCAGDGATNGGGIPGIPDLRDDGFFAVPQNQGGRLVVVTGNVADVMTVEQHDVLAYSNEAVSEVGNDGQVVFDADGALYATVMANRGGEGRFVISTSTDDARSFQNVTFSFDKPVSSVYLDGNKFGPGALVNWGLRDGDHDDWYFGHLFLDDDGKATLTNEMLAFEDGPVASRHVQGAALGPDGRAYMVMSDVSGNDDAAMAAAAGTTPLRVVVQQEGAVMPASP